MDSHSKEKLAALRSEFKTERTLFIETHHKKLQEEAEREAREEAAIATMFSSATVAPVQKSRLSRHGSSRHVLYNKHDSHHWGGVHNGNSFDEYDQGILSSFDRLSGSSE